MVLKNSIAYLTNPSLHNKTTKVTNLVTLKTDKYDKNYRHFIDNQFIYLYLNQFEADIKFYEVRLNQITTVLAAAD